MIICLSTALHMSYTVADATKTPVMASISTPVRPVHRAVQLTSTKWVLPTGDTLLGSSSTATEDRVQRTPTKSNGIVWHMGIRSAHFLAAMTPAISATLSTSPFFHSITLYKIPRGLGHVHSPLRRCHSRARRLRVHIHHARFAATVYVCQAGLCAVQASVCLRRRRSAAEQ